MHSVVCKNPEDQQGNPPPALAYFSQPESSHEQELSRGRRTVAVWICFHAFRSLITTLRASEDPNFYSRFNHISEACIAHDTALSEAYLSKV